MNKWILLSLSLIGLLSQNCKTLSSGNGNRSSNIPEKLGAGLDVVLTGAVIQETVTLQDLMAQDEHMIVGSNIKFQNCTFEDLIDISPSQGGQLTFSKQVVFEGCTFKKGIKINDVIFDGRFQLNNCVIEGSLDLQRNTFRHRCRINDNAIGQDLILQYSRFLHELSIFKTEAGRHFSLQGISVAGQCQLSSSTMGNSLVLSNAIFHETFIANYLKVGQKLLAGNSRFNGRVDFIDLECHELVKLSQAEVMGVIRMSLPNCNPEIDTRDCFLLQSDAFELIDTKK